MLRGTHFEARARHAPAAPAPLAAAVAAAAVLCAAVARALPLHADALTDADTFHSHPALTQAISAQFPSETLEDLGKQGTLYNEEELQNGNKEVYVSYSRVKRQIENDTRNEPDTKQSSEDNEPVVYVETSSEEIPSSPTPIDSAEKPQDDVTGMDQHFFPSFAPLFPQPLGHSRPPLVFQEQAHSHRPSALRPQINAFQPIGFGGPFRESKYIQAPAVAPSTRSSSILGSGNFGVIQGGTFYDDERGELNEYESGESQAYSPFYHNGHGRPAFYNGASNPRPQHHRGNDFFANFRDFADINTPPKASYSEFYVVYVNRNSTTPKAVLNNTSTNEKPKNIIDQLRIIDQEDKNALTKAKMISTSLNNGEIPESKLSASKIKLLQMQIEKQRKQKSKIPLTTAPKDLYEPLIAQS